MSETKREDDDLEQLLPWYVNGTLTAEEHQAVEAYLARSESARTQAAFLARVREAVRDQEHGSPGAFGLARLKTAMAAGEAGRDAKPAPAKSSPTTQRWRMVAAAAGVVVMIQAGLLFESFQQPAYQPLGAADTAPIQVSFRDEASAGQIGALLAELGASIRSGPGSLGIYRLALEEGAASVDEVVAALRAAGIVEDVRADP